MNFQLFSTCSNSLTYKIVCCLFVLLLRSEVTNAQALFALLFGKKISNDKLELGIHLGEQVSVITGSNDGRSRIGFAIGAYTDIKLSNRWRFCNYFIFKSPKGVRKLPLGYSLGQAIDTVFAQEGSIARRLSYIELTPLIRYQLSPSFSIGIGPQVSYLAAAKDQYSEPLSTGELLYEYKIRNYTQQFDVGSTVDIQYHLLKGKGLRLNIRYSAGFINIYKDSAGLSGRNSVWHLGIGIPIRGKDYIEQLQNTPSP